MKKITYKVPADSILVGVPFSWGIRKDWYMKSDDGVIFCLNNGRVSSLSELHVLQGGDFTYAASMELK